VRGRRVDHAKPRGSRRGLGGERPWTRPGARSVVPLEAVIAENALQGTSRDACIALASAIVNPASPPVRGRVDQVRPRGSRPGLGGERPWTRPGARSVIPREAVIAEGALQGTSRGACIALASANVSARGPG
jgi:hypothetical protein